MNKILIIMEDMKKIDLYFHEKYHLLPSYRQCDANLHQFNSDTLHDARKYSDYIALGLDDELTQICKRDLEEIYTMFLTFIPDEAFV